MSGITYLSDAITRIAAIYDSALAVPSVVPRAPFVADYFPYERDTFPYVTIRLGGDASEIVGNAPELDTYTVIARVVVGHLTSNFDGANVRMLYTIVPAVKRAFRQAQMLVTSDYPDIIAGMVDTQLYAPTNTGTAVFDTGGIGSLQVGVEFTHTLQFIGYEGDLSNA